MSKFAPFFVPPLNSCLTVFKLRPSDLKQDVIEVEAALQYNDGYIENILSFANNINTEEGGTHLAGFKASITRVINDYARNNLLSNGRKS
ncbi:unnamed protein product, partial [marine sediment metagenome]